MGTSLSRYLSRLWNRNDRRMLLVGLDAAGKTTILYNLRLGKVISSIPTVGFNVETVKYGQYKLHIWDVGGQDSLRPYWRHHFTGTQGIIFVIDSADVERLQLAKAELDGVLMDSQLREASLLVYLNKRDLPGVMSVEDIVVTLDLDSSCQLSNRKFYIQPTIATTGDGLREGMTWLCENMTEL